ncbi:MAG: bifunctional diaminohydroxyphosphoribosylaminopyrimidine deaminase/5-amino-6-(5-phosphoribosylamino)uracil reductase RibD [Candidatus Altiarchaeota archaeon]
MDDNDFMRRALALAGKGNTSPNPLVGCVIVKNGRVMAEGFHRKAGLPHAEIEALRKLKCGEARGSTLYVTLEPCCHHGRTPPCTDAIIKAGVKRVVAAMRDPNPLVAGKGAMILRNAGVEVNVGVLRKEAEQLNEAYVHFMKTVTPFVTLKSAMSLDGKIAAKTGDSKWITGEKARKRVHDLRSRVDAVLVGVGTVLKDDPRLTCRVKGGRDPLRVIVDSHLRIPLEAKVLGDGNVVVATTKRHSLQKKKRLDNRGVDVWVVAEKNRRVNLTDLARVLGEIGVRSILIEGGGEVNASAIQAGIVNKVLFFISPMIVGGREAKTPVEGEGTKKIREAVKVRNSTVERIGDDFLVTGYLK